MRGETVGVWLLGRRDPDDFYPQQDIDLLDALGAQVAVTLQNIHLYGQAQREIAERRQAEERLQASLSEKVVLLQEVHHRVKNNLQIISSLLSLQSQSIPDSKAREAFQESRDRVRAMSMVHESLYSSEDLAQIDMARYVRNQVMHLQAGYSRLARGVSFEVEVEDISFGIDTGVPCGLLVNELVSNALKHAFPAEDDARPAEPTIGVALKRIDGERYVLRVSDNGVGLPPNLEMDDPQSLGLQLVRISTDQVEGSWNWIAAREAALRSLLSVKTPCRPVSTRAALAKVLTGVLFQYPSCDLPFTRLLLGR